MYPSKGSNPYGQQSYGAQQAYGQIPGSGYPVNQVGGPESGPQHALVARQSAMMGMGATQDTDMSGYRNHPSQASQYGGPYASVYGSSTLSSAQQVGGVSGKAAVSTSLQGRATYPSAVPESSKFSSGALGSGLGMTSDDYLSASNRGFTQKGDQFSSVKNSDYASMDRRHYSEHQGAYIGRELQSDSARRYGDSVPLSHPHQSEMHDHIDQASLLRQQQMLKAQSLQSGSDIRQADYYAVRAAPIHHGPQEVGSYGGRMDSDPRSLSILGSAPYGGQHAASILGGAPRRNVDELIYAQGSSSAGYGVGLPPGRDYVAGKGLRGPSLESDYQGSVLSRAHPSLGVSMLDEQKDDRNAYRRELEIREEERRRELMREREKREREERDRERDRERERDRLRERRDKERERDRKHLHDSRRERTPPRAIRDRRGSSSLRDEKPLRRVSPRRGSPRREAVHRHRSPVKEKKREYICKVYPFCWVEVERDYLSLSKRYPRLAIAPDFSKVILNWPRESLNLSLHTPVGFEHDLLEVDDKAVEKGTVSSDELWKSNSGATVWNAKVILMSGISGDALNELCSDKSADERIIHFNNILKFAILRKDRAFMAIGGPWNATVDGGYPSVDDSSLIQTAIRCVKDLTQLDLHNCQHWNRFLEIHYDRVGKDGLFSHKEVTVLFLPDLSECLPSLDLWRSQWIAHKKDVAEREQSLATKQEKKFAEKKEAVRGIKGDESGSKTAEDDSVKSLKAEDSPDEKVEVNTDNIGGSKKGIGEQKGKEPVLNETITEKEIKEAVDDKGKIDEKIIHDGSSGDPVVEVQKPVAKKKTVRKVVKTKVVGKKVLAATVDSAALDVKDEGDKQSEQENAAQEDESSAEPLNVKTSVRKKVVRKVAVSKSAQKEDEAIETSVSQSEKKLEKEPELQDGQANDKKEQSGTAVLQATGDKAPGKKKIVRKVIKRKVSASEDKGMKATNQNAEASKEDDAKGQAGKKDEELVEGSNSANKTTEVSKTVAVEKESLSEKNIKEENNDKMESRSGDDTSKVDKGGLKSSSEPEVAMEKDSKKDGQDIKKERIKDEKEKKNKDAKHESKEKLHKEEKEKGNSEEPPKHPGFFLQAKRSKGSKIRSMSLSLDGLLDYNDKDIEESTFELSLFAESFNEMLQYQMGCRILSFLEKLRKKFVWKRNQHKRQRDEDSEKGGGKEKSSIKRLKTSDDSPVENECHKSEIQDTSNQDNEEKVGVDGSAAGSDEPKIEKRTEDDVMEEEEQEEEEELEDPEEIFEEDQEMDAAAASDNEAQEGETVDRTADLEAGSDKTREDGNSKKSTNEKSSNEAVKVDENSDKEKEQKHPEREVSESVKEEIIDRELLQAFRFFDQSRVGYIKVEDLRCIIHNMGKFLSSRDVKELVQGALFESNSARDNRIFYKKLVRVTDL